MNLDHEISQEAFGELVGVSQATVSRAVADGVLPTPLVAGAALRAYCARLREQAAGRYSEGPLDLAQERAALARVQRQLAEERLALARGEAASIELLARTLATASQAVAERFDHLPGMLRRACPDLPPAATDHVMGVIAAARNAWVTETMALVTEAVTAMGAEDDDTDAGTEPA